MSQNLISKYLFLEQKAQSLEEVLTFLTKAGGSIHIFSESTHIEALIKPCKMMKIKKKSYLYSPIAHCFISWVASRQKLCGWCWEHMEHKARDKEELYKGMPPLVTRDLWGCSLLAAGWILQISTHPLSLQSPLRYSRTAWTAGQVRVLKTKTF